MVFATDGSRHSGEWVALRLDITAAEMREQTWTNGSRATAGGISDADSIGAFMRLAVDVVPGKPLLQPGVSVHESQKSALFPLQEDARTFCNPYRSITLSSGLVTCNTRTSLPN